MKNKKLLVIAGLLAVFVGLISFQNAAPDDPGGGGGEEGNGTSRDWQQNPPYVDSMWVQRLETCFEDGRNMIMRIKYIADSTLPSTIYIYNVDSNTIAFHDDGVAPDLVSGDYNYATYLKEDTAAFRAHLVALNDQSVALGTTTVYDGHEGKEMYLNETNLTEWDDYGVVFVHFVRYPTILTDCPDIHENFSLFVTSLAVTEDPSRTYKIYDVNNLTLPTPLPAQAGSGNPSGAWAFGQLIKNMANETVTGVSAKDFLKSWLKNWLADVTVNGQTVHGRYDMRAFLLYPWIIRADPTLHNALPLNTGLDTLNVATAADYLFEHPQQWDTVWTYLNEDTILKYAPFKLSAIVNRIDVRGNAAYGAGLNQAGETRFIFSLIAPVSGYCTTAHGTPFTFKHGGKLKAGEVPTPFQIGNSTNSDNDSNAINNGADWRGMNVILEYVNVQTDECQARDFAQQWVDLSNYDTMGSASPYNAALESITNQVTDTNAAPGRPNGSALGRIRTNERIFAPSGESGYGARDQDAIDSWDISNWELRQFEINRSTHLLVQVPCTNTPVSSANYIGNNIGFFDPAKNFQSIEMMGSLAIDSLKNPEALKYDTAKCSALMEWAYANQASILMERHLMPDTFPGTSIPMTGGSAILQLDYVHTLNFNWACSTLHHPYTPGMYTHTGDYQTERDLRHKLSLNTCQGCHAGETKVLFTQVRPLGYGEEADYMGTAPGFDYDVTTGNPLKLDTRFTQNQGKSAVLHGGTPQNDPNYWRTTAASNRYFVRVSPFITGRNLTGNAGASPNYDDDNPNDLNDADMSGDYWVNDPINMAHAWDTATNVPPRQGLQQHPFNQLKARKKDLCDFVNTPCTIAGVTRPSGYSEVVQIIRLTMQQPHIPGWH